MSNQLGDFLDGLAKATEALNNAVNKSEEDTESNSQKPIRLTAAKLNEIRWMTARQIETIYKRGKVPFVIDDDPKAYNQLRWMTQNQLEALFGSTEDK